MTGDLALLAELIASERARRHPDRPWTAAAIEPILTHLGELGLTAPAILAAGHDAAASPALSPIAIEETALRPPPSGPVCDGCGYSRSQHDRVAGRTYPAHPYAPRRSA